MMTLTEFTPLLIKLFLFFLTASLPAFAVLESNFMPLDQAERTWGRSKFEAPGFKMATPELRSSMVVDLIRRKVFVNQKFHDVTRDLGNPDATSRLGKSLAYRLGHDSLHDYQLVFLPDFTGKVVEEVEIEKVDASPRESKSSNNISADEKILPVTIEGPTAAKIFDQMDKINADSAGTRSTPQIRCSRSKCHLYIHSDGTIGF